MENLKQVYDDLLQGKTTRFPSSLSTQANVGFLIKYLIEDILKWSDEDVKEKYDNRLLKKYKLGPVCARLRMDVFATIDSAFPGRFKPWELCRVPRGLWSDPSMRAAAVRWMIEDKMGLKSIEEIQSRVFRQDFYDYGLAGILEANSFCFYSALDNAYPGQLDPRKLTSPPKVGLAETYEYVPKEPSIDESTAIDMVRWLIDRHLRWDKKKVCESISVDTFKKSGMPEVLEENFDGNLIAALDAAYPGEYRQGDLAYYRKRKQARKAFIQQLAAM